jgi:beta-1,4-mannooligosaccharide/beta-1,4-mannosyl-N-acetylglucosamine phosphorylase
MMKTLSPEINVVGQPLPNMPWEDRPDGCSDVVWRFSKNPVIPRDLIPCSNSIFNSAVVPYQGEFAGVFRCDDRRRHMQLHSGHSRDGIHWTLENDPIQFQRGAVGPGPALESHPPGRSLPDVAAGAL